MSVHLAWSTSPLPEPPPRADWHSVRRPDPHLLLVHASCSADEVLAVLRAAVPAGVPLLVVPVTGAVAATDLPGDTAEWLHSHVSGSAGAGGPTHG